MHLYRRRKSYLTSCARLSRHRPIHAHLHIGSHVLNSSRFWCNRACRGEEAGKRKEGEHEQLVLKHSIDGIEHLSFILGPHFSPTDSIPLPFKTEDEIRGNSCRGLLYFSSYFETDFEDGKVVICNLATKKLKLLTPPCYDAFYCDHGLGYDPVSDDYKLV
ncbi:hypothetical protein OROMI_010737 [Orobanche minor]